MIKINVVGAKLRPQLKRLEIKQATLLANDIFRSVKNLTPVDTGKAKRNWRLLRRQFGFMVLNSVKYITFLDKGSSKQAPRGMTQPTFERLRARNKIK
jgi:hypothetical protein